MQTKTGTWSRFHLVNVQSVGLAESGLPPFLPGYLSYFGSLISLVVYGSGCVVLDLGRPQLFLAFIVGH